jgi:YbbR domain-containing protein
VKALLQNLPLKVVSLCLACLVWLFVMGEEHSERSYTAPVVISRVPEGLVVVNEGDQFVEVRVSGPRGILNRLADDAFITILDLAPYGRGEVDVPIFREAVQAPAGVTISRIFPATIKMQLDALVEKEIPLHAVTTGRPAHGYEVKEVVLAPRSLLLTGPETLLNKISEIPTTPISVAGLTGDATVTADVDFQRRLVSWPNQPIRAQIVVVPRIVTQTMPVHPVLEGEVDTPFKVTGVEVDPATVAITGPEPSVERIQALTAPPINVAGEEKSFSRTLRLESPAEGVRLSDTDRVEVKVTLEEKELQRTVPVTATLQGKPHRDYQVGEVQVIPSTVRVTGPYRKVVDLEAIPTAPVTIADLEQLSMQQTTLNLPRGVERTGSAGKITVIVPIEDKIVQRRIPVRPAFSGAPKGGLRVAGVVVDPEEVALQGPSRQLRDLQGIPTAVLSYPERAGEHTISGARLLLPEGGVTAQPDRVAVIVTLMSSPAMHRRLPVRAILVDEPPPGFRLREVVVQPKEIEVKGVAERVNGLSELVTEPISLRGLTEATTITTRVITPQQGVEVTDSAVEVTVHVQREN